MPMPVAPLPTPVPDGAFIPPSEFYVSEPPAVKEPALPAIKHNQALFDEIYNFIKTNEMANVQMANFIRGVKMAIINANGALLDKRNPFNDRRILGTGMDKASHLCQCASIGGVHRVMFKIDSALLAKHQNFFADENSDIIDEHVLKAMTTYAVAEEHRGRPSIYQQVMCHIMFPEFADIINDPNKPNSAEKKYTDYVVRQHRDMFKIPKDIVQDISLASYSKKKEDGRQEFVTETPSGMRFLGNRLGRTITRNCTKILPKTTRLKWAVQDMLKKDSAPAAQETARTMK
ncbi:MAG: hypothetical protein FWE53_01945 [Firmicutes bacterium]|nr:hypothetical protein [Bacillota bacterium]